MTTLTRTRWSRTVTMPLQGTAPGMAIAMQHTEFLDMDAAVERLHEAMQERPDAGVRAWLDCALNGWGDD